MITIVTDSSACLRRDDARKLGVRVVPLMYTVGRQLFLESYSDENGAFEELIDRRCDCRTARPRVSAFLSVFEEECKKNREVLCLTISSRMSGTYSAAHAAARRVPDGRVTVFDSLSTCGGLFLLVERARLKTAFSVADMEPLRMSRRIGSVRMSIGSILNKRPILLCREGVIVSDGMAGGNTDVMRRLLRHMPAGTEFVINYIGLHHMAADLYNLLKKNRPGATILLRKLVPIHGIHVGTRVVVVSALTPER